MKINKFKKVSKGKYKIYLDNGDAISLYEDIIVKNNLLFAKEINKEKLDHLLKLNNDVYVYELAINYISVRLRSEKEVKEYLIKKGVSSLSIDDTCQRLKKEGYINDFNYAKAFLNDELNLTTKGPLKIKSELLKRGVSIDIILELIEGIEPEFIRNKLSNLIEKQIKIKKGSASMLKMKLLNYFIDLGYDKYLILNLLDDIKLETDPYYLQKEYDKLYSKYSKKYEGYKLKTFILSKLYAKGYSSQDISKIKQQEN